MTTRAGILLARKKFSLAASCHRKSAGTRYGISRRKKRRNVSCSACYPATPIPRISPTGEVIDGTRFLSGPTLFRDSAMQAVRQWKFRPDSEDEQAVLGRVRALIWYKADGSAEVALAPAILPDSFGDPGTPRSEGGRSLLSCASM